jgi:hypothetical protein
MISMTYCRRSGAKTRRLKMSLKMLPILVAVSLSIAALQARADEPYRPDPLELAPAEPIKCEWSKLNYEELKICRKRKEFFDKMTAEDKEKYNEEVAKRRLEERIERLDTRTR